MTIRRLGFALAFLTLGYGCASGGSIDDNSGSTGGSDANGGKSSTATDSGGTSTSTSTSTSTTTSTGGTTNSSNATMPSSGGSTKNVTVAAGGNSSSTQTTAATSVVTPSSCGTTSGELTMVHASQPGGNGYTGNTIITPGTVTTLKADAIQLKACFSTIGDVPAALAATNMKIYHASVEGGPAYKELTQMPISIEKPASNRFCFVFDLTTFDDAAGLTVTSPADIKYNWSFDSTQVTGLAIDAREQNKPTLVAVYDGNVAACTTL